MVTHLMNAYKFRARKKLALFLVFISTVLSKHAKIISTELFFLNIVREQGTLSALFLVKESVPAPSSYKNKHCKCLLLNANQ
jgi:hypothetical protein